MPRKIATVIGSTGLIGSQLMELLKKDDSFETIRALVRRPVDFNHTKVEMKLVNFEDQESVKLAIDGSNAVFCAIGTTQKKVNGNKAAYRKVDFDIPVSAARFCAETGCPNFLLVSSVGANSESSNFYLKLKGEVEDAIKGYSIPNISIYRPSMLVGKREEYRFGERIGQPIMLFFAFMLVGNWEKYHPIDAVTVARAMIQSVKEENRGMTVYEYDDMLQSSKRYALNVTEHLHLEE